jgi:uncharacterized protein YbjT (DUF2867 family)
MRVFLAGATGFIGGHVVRALSERGHEVSCLVRGADPFKALALPGVRTVTGDFTAPASYVGQVPGHDVVLNAVGIIRETDHARFQIVHEEAPITLFDAAARGGVRKIIQISALGADEQAQSRYHLTKRAADRHLAGLGVPYVILRPSLVYGPQDHSMTFFLALAALPITPVPGDGQYRVQPVHIDDLVRAVVLAVERDDLRDFAVDVGGGEPIPFDHMLDELTRRLGKRAARKLHVPWPLMEMTAKVTDALGGRGPITGEELGMLRRGNWADRGPFVQRFGFEPAPFAVGIARKPLTEADAWHARLAFLRVPLRLSVAFIWLATGLVSATVSAGQGFELLEHVGLTGPLAGIALYGTSLLEVLLALATALGWRVRLMGAVQILLMLGFMAILTVRMPELWLHPFGPLTKNIPLIGATLVMMALEDHSE